jgi:hypothetical protein
MKPKVHIHEEQFDGVMHAWCGRGGTAVGEEVFAATPAAERCAYCDREWFPHGQPDWDFRHAVQALTASPPPPPSGQTLPGA